MFNVTFTNRPKNKITSDPTQMAEKTKYEKHAKIISREQIKEWKKQVEISNDQKLHHQIILLNYAKSKNRDLAGFWDLLISFVKTTKDFTKVENALSCMRLFDPEIPLLRTIIKYETDDFFEEFDKWQKTYYDEKYWIKPELFVLNFKSIDDLILNSQIVHSFAVLSILYLKENDNKISKMNKQVNLESIKTINLGKDLNVNITSMEFFDNVELAKFFSDKRYKFNRVNVQTLAKIITLCTGKDINQASELEINNILKAKAREYNFTKNELLTVFIAIIEIFDYIFYDSLDVQMVPNNWVQTGSLERRMLKITAGKFTIYSSSIYILFDAIKNHYAKILKQSINTPRDNYQTPSRSHDDDSLEDAPRKQKQSDDYQTPDRVPNIESLGNAPKKQSNDYHLENSQKNLATHSDPESWALTELNHHWTTAPLGNRCTHILPRLLDPNVTDEKIREIFTEMKSSWKTSPKIFANSLGEIRKITKDCFFYGSGADHRLSVKLIKGVDALKLTALPHELIDNSVIQVASQFNFLESPSSKYSETTNYIYDRTQGPRSSLLFPGSLLTRDENMKDNDAGSIFFNSSYNNGYFEPRNCSLEDYLSYKINIEYLRILIQDGCSLFSNIPMTQVFCAAPSFQGAITPKENSFDAKLCDLLVGAQYEAIGRVAAWKSIVTSQKVNLHLTLVGQGAFNNPKSTILNALLECFNIVQYHNVDVFIHVFDDDAFNNLPDVVKNFETVKL